MTTSWRPGDDQEEIVRLLLQAGGNPNAKNAAGLSPYDLANEQRKQGALPIMEFFMILAHRLKQTD
ncbi:ankyrin repeat domain-containing protein [Marinicella meishanensis]|uniref:ankyrin repeat domain-containing protein n=1 Tax=Marinicella meishanensis TaxID=2873263 RepID=UPI001CC077D1|nr:ankyrin repeat domain-containing protein [Marinicella sp. NBU2979]